MSLEFLGLDPTTSSTKEVKREYARRLKTCRPDQDPEGFRVLHEAYTAALNEITWRDAGAAPPVISSEAGETPENQTSGDQEQFSESSKSWNSSRLAMHPEVQAALERLEEELRSGGGNVEPLAREVEAVLYRDPDAVIPWGEFLYRLFTLYGSNPDLRLKSEALCFEMENNGALATLAVVERIDRTGNVMAISTFTEQFALNAKRIRTPACGAVAARLACAAAFWSPGHTGALADIAYENLDRQERDYHMHHIEQHGHMRDLLKSIPKRFQGFWRQKLMRVPGGPDWTSREAAEAIQWISLKTVSGTQAAQVLRQLLPVDLAERIPVIAPEEILKEKDPHEKYFETRKANETVNSGNTPLWDQPTAPVKRQQTSARRFLDPDTSRSWTIPRAFGMFLCFIIVRGVVSLFTTAETSVPSGAPPRLPPGVVSLREFDGLHKTIPQSQNWQHAEDLFPTPDPTSAGEPRKLPQPLSDAPAQNPMLKLMNGNSGGQ